MLLNGNVLSVNSSGIIPPLEPLHVISSEPIMVAPLSIVFVHMPGVIVPACKARRSNCCHRQARDHFSLEKCKSVGHHSPAYKAVCRRYLPRFSKEKQAGTSCSTPTPPGGPKLKAISKVSIPDFGTGSYDVGQCWSSLTKVNGCGTEILESIAGGLMQTSVPISHGCCRAIVKIGHDCWSKMFPPNPFFPFAEDMVWSYCIQA
ncbi:hypothetical protein V6N11_046763 [Hibiscus sabdariffa]|uniref:Prolamin-like domain-containing protein n=1 Tax=Hibiscus sabdariffa TaxID=183260 RepID=A0ABR1Z9U5_9ROSI